MTINAHQLFHNSSRFSPSYLQNLAVPPSIEDRLRRARDEMREELRLGLRNWSNHVARADLFEEAASVDLPALRPKFRMQGSFSYRTCNEPDQKPPQEVDLDDGMFLPTSFFTSGRRANPIIASAGLFVAVETILRPLCTARGWRLVTTKPSCVRVKITDDAHIDLALYAVPDIEYSQLLEKALLAEARESRAAKRNKFDEQLGRGDDLRD